MTEGGEEGKKTEKKQLEKSGVDERRKVTPNGEMSTKGSTPKVMGSRMRTIDLCMNVTWWGIETRLLLIRE